MLELDDIQSGVLRPRPALRGHLHRVRIDERNAGRELMRSVCWRGDLCR
jgi:hypothetical protein